MLTFILVLMMNQLPPGKIPEKKPVENCITGENTEKILKLKRIDLSFTVSEKKIFSGYSLSFVPSKEWKKSCRYSLKHNIKVGEVPENTPVKAELSNGTNIIKIPARVVKKDKNFFIESSIALPPLESEPSDNILTFKFDYETEKFPVSDETGMKKLVIFLRQFLKYKTADDFSGKVFAEIYDRWISHGSTLPEDNTVGKRHGWKLTRKFSQDLTILFADFEITGDPQKSGDQPRPEQIDPKLFLITSISSLAVIGIVLFIYRRRKAKTGEKEVS